MSETILVRTERHPDLPPPARKQGIYGWARANLFSTPGNAALTLACLALILLTVPPFIDWAFFRAVWNAPDGTLCRVEGAGACWAFIEAKFGQFIYGRYPRDELWRPNLVLALFFLNLVPLFFPRLPYKGWIAATLLFIYPMLAWGILHGGKFGLSMVETTEWGGLLITLVIAVSGILASLPLGILLALGRRSKLPAVRVICILFIEFWRGVPLVTVLFMASVMLPLFLPSGVTFDLLLRALIGVALFASAYMAEVVRGGLQAVPGGQYEAARALGLSYWQMMSLIVLPQALRTVIPGIVNTFIGLFKDTTLVLIIGLFDFLGIIRANFTDAAWASPGTAATGYVFAAFVYWIFCFSMSRYSLRMERQLGQGSR
ncbi:amino acid ABC transporter permease [Tepidicaulis sp. LMO-SS28]|uniref:amino acid ABC transporter permease n=1 Tax=Tepidicaulis sp. LMO-SS28 TaxID=3447455 RepID=UPI003EE24E62